MAPYMHNTQPTTSSTTKKNTQHHDPSGRRLPAASILMVSAIFLQRAMAHDICNVAIHFLYETNSSLYYLLLFSVREIQGQSCRCKSSVLLAPDVGNGLNYPYTTQFKNDQNTNVIMSNPTTLDDMGDGFVSDWISNNDGRIRGGMRCSIMMLVEEWMG
jgi:hypothetical protein